MSSEIDLVDDLIRSGEGLTVDFKRLEIISNSVKLAALMVAFGNTCGGRILIGVNDDGSIEGMREKKEHETHIMNIARDKCAPPIIPEFSVSRKEGGDIYVVKIARYRKIPYAVITGEGNVYFIRVGSTVRLASPNELALLFEADQDSASSKKPVLDLLLIDGEGNAVKEIHAEPIFVKRILRKSAKPDEPMLPSAFLAAAKILRAVPPLGLGSFEERAPPKDLIPIGIQIVNKGEIPAQGVRLTLQFPADCEIIEKRDAVGGISVGPILPYRPNSGGLFAGKDRHEAYARIDTLGNDLTCSFEKIYVRFPQLERQYKIQGHITQHGFPPTDLEFLVSVKPKIVEEVVEEYGEDQ